MITFIFSLILWLMIGNLLYYMQVIVLRQKKHRLIPLLLSVVNSSIFLTYSPYFSHGEVKESGYHYPRN
ncbi:Ammonium transporter [Microcystis aeruginosa NIES-2549]|uniref:Ammonium transporter n=1 Tax=Microcystis aeruginosa NIES-2549 TaxID=1641812 RepID=A0A0F6U308_MICAE|nr:Ammonium transporter [Microcystis aeruginosa NIES-2549]